MARSIEEIKNELTGNFISNSTIIEKYGLDPDKTFNEQFSRISMESIYFYAVAFSIWTLEKLFDTHKNEVNNIIAEKDPHHLRWYASKSRDFQYGFDLLPDSDQFNNSGKTEEEIESSKIIKAASVSEVERALRIKVAKDSGGNLSPLSENELTAFSAYMQLIKDAGVRLEIESNEADRLVLYLKVYYNPLLLTLVDGKLNRIDGAADNVIVAATRSYLQQLLYDGKFVTEYLTDALQQVEGVEIPHIINALAAYGDLEPQPVNVIYLPFSGIIRIADSDFHIDYIPRA